MNALKIIGVILLQPIGIVFYLLLLAVSSVLLIPTLIYAAIKGD